jgi:hypothetical protein
MFPHRVDRSFGIVAVVACQRVHRHQEELRRRRPEQREEQSRRTAQLRRQEEQQPVLDDANNDITSGDGGGNNDDVDDKDKNVNEEEKDHRHHITRVAAEQEENPYQVVTQITTHQNVQIAAGQPRLSANLVVVLYPPVHTHALEGGAFLLYGYSHSLPAYGVNGNTIRARDGMPLIQSKIVPRRDVASYVDSHLIQKN